MIGVIMRMGLVTKNAILLVDFASHERARGESIHDALVNAGTTHDLLETLAVRSVAAL